MRFGRVGCTVVRLRIAKGRAIGVGRYRVADELAGSEAVAEVLIEVVLGHLVPFYRAKVLQCIVEFRHDSRSRNSEGVLSQLVT